MRRVEPPAGRPRAQDAAAAAARPAGDPPAPPEPALDVLLERLPLPEPLSQGAWTRMLDRRGLLGPESAALSPSGPRVWLLDAVRWQHIPPGQLAPTMASALCSAVQLDAINKAAQDHRRELARAFMRALGPEAPTIDPNGRAYDQLLAVGLMPHPSPRDAPIAAAVHNALDRMRARHTQLLRVAGRDAAMAAPEGWAELLAEVAGTQGDDPIFDGAQRAVQLLRPGREVGVAPVLLPMTYRMLPPLELEALALDAEQLAEAHCAISLDPLAELRQPVALRDGPVWHLFELEHLARAPSGLAPGLVSPFTRVPVVQGRLMRLLTEGSMQGPEAPPNSPVSSLPASPTPPAADEA